MSGAGSAVADPLTAAVDRVAAVEGGLTRQHIETVVCRVAGGRAKRRRLAAALAQRPQVLLDGRSPAPRVVGELLLALVGAGATTVAAPRCAVCTRPLRALQRRGQDWLCARCAPLRQPCAGCGRLARICERDRDGRPRCVRCRERTAVDPVRSVVELIAAVDPTLPAQRVRVAVATAAPQLAARRRLAWVLAERPALLTGEGAHSPVPSVLRLIDELCAAGAVAVTRPSCPGCARVVPLVKPRGGVRLCRTCVARSRAEPCAGCGRVAEPAARDGDGRPLCVNCYVRDPVNHEVCISCGRRRPVGARTVDGPRCASCPPLPIAVCSLCGQRRACGTSRLTAAPVCPPCQHRSAACGRCGQLLPIASGTVEDPVCAGCTVQRLPDCRTCAGRARPGRCSRCRLALRLRALTSGTDGATHPALRPLAEALAGSDRPEAVLHWLANEPVATVLADIACGARELTHAEFDRLGSGGALAHLRSVLVATGALPARDEQMARLQRFVDDALTGRADVEQRQILHRYALWHLLRRLRRRNGDRDTTREQYSVVTQQVRDAGALLDWLAAQQLTLATAGQGDLDRWRSHAHCDQAGHFIRWAADQRLTTLTFPATRWRGPMGAFNDDARWQAARRLLHDETVSVRDRVAGLLVVLYAQPVARIARLSLQQVTITDTHVLLQLGASPIAPPDALAELIRRLIAGKRGHATTGAIEPSPWLFPGGQPGLPISATHLSARLKQLGIQPGQARSTALFQLAGELPAAVVARLLGLHVDVAVAWQRASAGDWTSYAAEVSRRSRPTQP